MMREKELGEKEMLHASKVKGGVSSHGTAWGGATQRGIYFYRWRGRRRRYRAACVRRRKKMQDRGKEREMRDREKKERKRTREIKKKKINGEKDRDYDRWVLSLL